MDRDHFSIASATSYKTFLSLNGDTTFLHICEHGGEKGIKTWEKIDEVLDTVSLVFSCLFMVELVASVYAFGLGYFTSQFHTFDALVILASFIVDVCLHGPVEEAGTLIIVLRLFRVFKIVEESSTVAEETLDQLQERIDSLEKENNTLKRRIGNSSYQSTD
ncbi:putative ion transport [Phaeomoniella chlamydospora]|uniref:Voltage-gated hydrogen channel 1 n=1 Tax=Phaeomoniella chlamydospora TaxID=158046 RepID=A0A0G2GNW5_PHACM|nr:putative ion transport [Phaeomoniella chlamydospora]